MDRTESSNKGGKYQGSGYVYTVHEQIHTYLQQADVICGEMYS